MSIVNNMVDKKAFTAVIGITGGIGSGKSYVVERISSLFKTLVIPTDEIAKAQMKQDGCSYQHVVQEFGSDILDQDKEIDRQKLADLVFHDALALAKLNSITHPLVMEEVKKQIQAAKNSGEYHVILLESALLTQAGYKKYCDEVWYIHASKETRMFRLHKNRNMQWEDIDAVMKNQADEEKYRSTTDRQINNDFSVGQTELDDQLKSIIENLLKNIYNAGNHNIDMV